MHGVEREAAVRVPRLLESLLGLRVEVLPDLRGASGRGPGLVLRAEGHTFVIEVKGSDSVAVLERGWHQLHRLERGQPDEISLLVVPYMGPKARSYAREHRICWIDLCGNVDIHAKGLRILVTGQRNRFGSPGRPANVFSPRASRISRVLLVDPQRWWRQRDLAAETGLPDGTVSKVIHRLLDQQLIERDQEGAIRAPAPSLLLDAWAQKHRFEDNDIRRFHAVGRSGQSVLRTLAGRLSREQVPWAATGLGAAWLWTHFADFRLTTIYLDAPALEPEALDLRPVDRGENVWLVTPRDAGVFYGVQEREGVRCAHPVQVYLDLLGHPERSAEAASRLRAELLTWSA